MPSNNYVLLERIELNASAASVVFNNIPQTGYTDLKIVVSARGDAAYVNNGCFMQINSVTSGYTTKDLYGDGASAASSTNPYGITSKTFVGAVNGTGSTGSTFGNKEVYIPNYTSSNSKSISTDSVIETNGTTAYMDMLAAISTNTAPVTSLTFSLDSGNFVANSTFSLYALAALGTTPAIAPKADGGNVIATDGTYWYHAFLANGTFTPQVALNADLLVVAGGGGGGSTNGGAGGAGGALGLTAQSLATTGYAITIGSGGTGAPSGGATRGTNGINSQFGALTAAVGGGAGGSYSTPAGVSGGSGGGGSGADVAGAAGSGTSSQGNAGFNGNTGQIGGGGGGAGASATSKAGAVGTSIYSTWGAATVTGEQVGGTYYFAGGGGGGTNSGAGGDATTAGAGGYGGGASGRNQASLGAPTAALVNTGGGGGGSGGNGNSAAGGAGGSGIVIIRYPIAS